MITLLEIADLLAELLETESVTAGCIDASKPETIGVYQREGFVPRECIGTESSYQTAKIRILVHWTDNPSQAERKAIEIAELFSGFEDIETENHIIKFAEVKAVRSIGKDEKGICEYIADANLIYTERTI
ncbi:MAG: minor capsid protein [Ruminococcus sp.]|nr:minor capsid protein [Ruminococcus sp.]